MKDSGKSGVPGPDKKKAKKSGNSGKKAGKPKGAGRTAVAKKPPRKKAATAPPESGPGVVGGALVDRSSLESHIFDVEEAIELHRAVTKARAELGLRGLTDKEMIDYGAQIEAAKKVENLVGRLSLDTVRRSVRDLVGEYRCAAELVCMSMDSFDAKLAEAMHCQGKFPDNDPDLDRYLPTLAGPIAEHSAELARRGFTLKMQGEFATASQNFHAAMEQRLGSKDFLDDQTARRQTVLAALRANTKYMRAVGRAANRKSGARVAFDRPRTNSTAAAEAAAKRAAAQAKKAEAVAELARAKAAKKAALAEKAKAKKAAKKAAKKKKRGPRGGK